MKIVLNGWEKDGASRKATEKNPTKKTMKTMELTVR